MNGGGCGGSCACSGPAAPLIVKVSSIAQYFADFSGSHSLRFEARKGNTIFSVLLSGLKTKTEILKFLYVMLCGRKQVTETAKEPVPAKPILVTTTKYLTSIEVDYGHENLEHNKEDRTISIKYEEIKAENGARWRTTQRFESGRFSHRASFLLAFLSTVAPSPLRMQSLESR